MIRPLTPQLQKKAEEELNEVPNRIQSDLKHTKEWIESQTHLKARTDDQWLIGFLRGCKFSLERTKEKIDYFYTMRSLLPEVFADRDPFLPEIQEVLKAGVIFPLPKGEDATPRIIFFNGGVCNVDKMTLVHLAKVYFMTMDILIKEDDNCVVAGKLLLGDVKNMSLNYMLQLTPSFVKQIILCLEHAYPIRNKGGYCINAPAVLETTFNLAKRFMSEKMKNRINLYSENNFDEVYKNICQSLMPKEYGGGSGTVDELATAWKIKLESCREWFLEDAQYCSNEKLRPGKPKTSADLYGVEGTFRKLVID